MESRKNSQKAIFIKYFWHKMIELCIQTLFREIPALWIWSQQNNSSLQRELKYRRSSFFGNTRFFENWLSVDNKTDANFKTITTMAVRARLRRVCGIKAEENKAKEKLSKHFVAFREISLN